VSAVATSPGTSEMPLSQAMREEAQLQRPRCPWSVQSTTLPTATVENLSLPVALGLVHWQAHGCSPTRKSRSGTPGRAAARHALLARRGI